LFTVSDFLLKKKPLAIAVVVGVTIKLNGEVRVQVRLETLATRNRAAIDGGIERRGPLLPVEKILILVLPFVRRYQEAANLPVAVQGHASSPHKQAAERVELEEAVPELLDVLRQPDDVALESRNLVFTLDQVGQEQANGYGLRHDSVRETDGLHAAARLFENGEVVLKVVVLLLIHLF
jgi:hypothetical protein